MLKKNNYKRLLLVTIIVLLYLLSSFYMVFKTDEEVSMGLIQHSASRIISIDILDVHPPLYYLLLKYFLLITTFWTKSVFFKTFFARCFSILFLILFIYYMFNIVKICNIYVNTGIEILLFLLSPGVINESAKIRMYSLAAFLLAFEFYQLIEFIKNKKNINIILATIFSSMATYTIYPLAISAGLFLLIFFVYELYKYRIGVSIKLFISGIIVIFAYIPWMKILLMQIRRHSSSDGSLVPNYFYTITSSITQLNAPSPTSPLLKYTCFISILVILLFSYLTYFSIKHLNNTYNRVLLIILIDFILTILITVLFCKRQFRLTTIYPIYSILIFMMIIIVIKYVSNKNSKRIINKFIILLFTVFTLYSIAACVNNIKNYDLPSIQFYYNFNKWKKSKSKDINVDKVDNIKVIHGQVVGNTTYVTQDAMYLKSVHKNALINVNKNMGKRFISGLSNNNHNYKFFKKLFTNLRFKSP